ncbi:MAG: hypothetical protein ACREMA_07110 [Longimicrobiales bacterium]
MRLHLVAVSVLSLFLVFSAVSAGQQVSSRALDAQSRSALRAAAVTLLKADSVLARVATDERGFFRLQVRDTGRHLLRVELIGYEPHSHFHSATGQDQELPAFLMRTQAVPLDSVVARTSPVAERAAATSRQVRSGERLKRLEQHGATIYTVIRELGGSLRMREVFVQGRRYTCVESTRRIMTLNGRRGPGACQMVAVFENGVMIEDPLSFLSQINVSHYESVEFIKPADAGLRHGLNAGGVGALELWIRGSCPHKNSARN